MVLVELCVRGTPPRDGVVIGVLGDADLGDWDPAATHHLTRVEDDKWRCCVTLPPSPLRYRYVWMDPVVGTVEAWEAFRGTRFVYPGMVNIAVGKPTRMSSSVPGQGSDSAVNGNIYAKSVVNAARTLVEHNPWWEVTPGSCSGMEEVVVYRKPYKPDADPISQRPYILHVLLAEGSFPDNCTLEEAMQHAHHRYRQLVIDMETPDVISVAAADFVAGGQDGVAVGCLRVYAEGTRSLDLCEVQVFTAAFPDGSMPVRQETSVYTLEGEGGEPSIRQVVDDGAYGMCLGESGVRSDSGWLRPDGGPVLHVITGVELGHPVLTPVDGRTIDHDTVTIEGVVSVPSNGSEISIRSTVRRPLDWLKSDTPLPSAPHPVTHLTAYLPARADPWFVWLTVKAGGIPLGRCCLSGAAVLARDLNQFALPVVGGEGDVVGVLRGRYLLTQPFQHSANTLELVWRRRTWRNKGLDIGHRGAGQSFKDKGPVRRAGVAENSLLSFQVAGSMATDYVEFDVLLTADDVPVIYHDFEFLCAVKEAAPVITSGSTAHVLHPIGIHQLTHRDLATVDKMRAPERPLTSLQYLCNKHWRDILAMRDHEKTPLHRARSFRFVPAVSAAIPTLQALFEHVPVHVGFDIEIKYPVGEPALRAAPMYSAMNKYLDCILSTVFEWSADRRVFFTCFDPDVCLMLTQKQAKYPVLLLTSSGVESHSGDARVEVLDGTVLGAAGGGLQGIVALSTPFLEHPELTAHIQAQNLMVMTWGDGNTNPTNVQTLKASGMDAVIADNIGDLTAHFGKAKSVFQP